jgi:hypothetical protein
MATGSPALQSGTVTPAHLAVWVTDGVIGDAGASLFNTFGVFSSVILGVNFNSASSDNPIPINLPIGYSRYRIHDILISGASANCSSATCGVFTQPGGGGVQVVTNNTAVTVSSTVPDANNTMQALSINNQNIVAFVDTVLFFRINNAQGTPATANVTVNYEPLP